MGYRPRRGARARLPRRSARPPPPAVTHSHTHTLTHSHTHTLTQSHAHTLTHRGEVLLHDAHAVQHDPHHLRVDGRRLDGRYLDGRRLVFRWTATVDRHAHHLRSTHTPEKMSGRVNAHSTPRHTIHLRPGCKLRGLGEVWPRPPTTCVVVFSKGLLIVVIMCVVIKWPRQPPAFSVQASGLGVEDLGVSV